MRTLHDQYTHQSGDRLETIVMGLGLVRLLQDARRFDEAKATLCSLEEGFQEVAEKSAKKRMSPGQLAFRRGRHQSATLLRRCGPTPCASRECVIRLLTEHGAPGPRRSEITTSRDFGGAAQRRAAFSRDGRRATE